MTVSFSHRSACALVVAGSFITAAGALASPQSIAELKLQRQESQSKRIFDKPPLFGDYLASGDGRGYPFEIIGVYTPDPSDPARWRISGAIAFDDTRLLGTLHAPITGTFEGSTNSARYTVWVDGKSR